MPLFFLLLSSVANSQGYGVALCFLAIAGKDGRRSDIALGVSGKLLFWDGNLFLGIKICVLGWVFAIAYVSACWRRRKRMDELEGMCHDVGKRASVV